jgi:hypothetical protein
LVREPDFEAPASGDGFVFDYADAVCHPGILAFALDPAGDEKNYQRNSENDQAEGVCIVENRLYA